ncbi:cyanophycin synthetase [Rhodocytophaga aerolata]|uniref:Cyanophycin synthetase n=1 Tax=Rhodocytophaga aerolata TaxID=455078 RepID=A0ABT8R369_9BACT|nr:cyanophycin synthetase [Rhodocytophaga aerolata]MDO1445824.1 cyanophycin synthetase [Rhodocytophaga aerolata]
MKVHEIKAMRGPNYWSVRYHKLIVMKLDLEELEHLPTNKIPGFAENLENQIPSLYTHYCSEGQAGGFLKRVKEGTWMGHVIEHIALELQTLAGMDCGFGRTRGTGEEGVYFVVFAYQEEKAGLYAAAAAVRIAEALISGSLYNVQADIVALRKIALQEYPGPSTGSILEEAKNRNIPYFKLEGTPIIQFGYGKYQKRIRATISSQTSSLGVDIACNKEETKRILGAAAIPVPKGMIVHTAGELNAVADHIGYPLVIKPVDGNQGKGATIGIKNRDELEKAFALAKTFSASIIVEKLIAGHDFRLLVINYKLVAAALRTPACVTGDGRSTIRQLIDQINSDPARGSGHENVLTAIQLDEVSYALLAEKGFTLDSVLTKGEVLHLKKTANLSTGGTATDVTDQLHPDTIAMAERIARIVGLDICGIDIMAPSIDSPITQNGGAVLEVNAAPGFRMHLCPTVGLARNVAKPVIDMLFPAGSNSRIPVVAVTGTNGKTTTTRLIAHMAKKAGYQVGYTTTDGIYIGDKLMVQGDCTGPASTEFILKDPTVDFAVLECARGGILRSGLGFDYCDIGIVTNVSDDHLGINNIDTLEKMAKVKSVIPESVSNHGYAILNADDDLVYDMARDLDCKIALFSLDAHNPRIKRHCEQEGLAVVVEEKYITVYEGKWKTRIEQVDTIPLTFGGKAGFMIQNILPAVLTGYIRGFAIKDIRQALQTFIPSPEQTPGRLNIFEFNEFKVMVDYAHNPAGFRALAQFLATIADSPKVGIVTGVGDRRNEDILKLGELSAQMFDEIIIRQDKDLRGRADMEIVHLMRQGIEKTAPAKPVKVIATETESVVHAVKYAKKGAFITVCSEDLHNTLALLKKLQQEEEQFGMIVSH